MHIDCKSCGRSDLRISRLRTTDLPHLLLLQYPLRCHACARRQYAFIVHALKLNFAEPRHPHSTKP